MKIYDPRMQYLKITPAIDSRSVTDLRAHKNCKDYSRIDFMHKTQPGSIH